MELKGNSLTIKLAGYWQLRLIVAKLPASRYYTHSNTSTPSCYYWSIFSKAFDSNLTFQIAWKMVAQSKGDGYLVTSQSSQFTSVSVFSLGRMVGPRIDWTLEVSCQRLGNQSKIPKSPFASENDITSKTTILLTDDQNVCYLGKQIYPRSQFIMWNILVCHDKLNKKRTSNYRIQKHLNGVRLK